MLKLVATRLAEEVGGTFALIGVYAVTFSPADISTMMMASAALVAAIGTAIANIITSRRVVAKVSEVSATVEKISTQTNEVSAETVKISGHVNSAATAAQGREDALRREIALLREMLTGKTQDAALLAQAASASVSAAAAPEVGPSPAVTSLRQIDENTAAIEKNTAKTEATVQELKEKT